MAIVQSIESIPKDAQSIFEYVLKHLREQGKRSRNAAGCCYRTRQGLACAAGCLIPESRMQHVIEGRAAHLLNNAALGPELIPHRYLLRGLQTFHDAYWLQGRPHSQLDKLKSIAEQFSLTVPEWVEEWIKGQEQQGKDA